ncbi:DNA-processing protein DprA [Corynebacterium halotolerans]|uniref:DNA processing protein n=1 Tax=Corynebacterium halotolerans YIM 70093 = DSM 44683 TaxID=1121362 RepID=M1NTH3_9CORY|nr:DNA-processing protein DprA [Corynebacterium halotolerans]AGF72777.1 DNA processing protein [Corynebacterium halotolerans YIM 70093 = DSM 44683]
MSTPESWAYLNRVVEGPSRALQELLAAGRDADEIADGVRRRASWLGGLAEETAARHDWDRAEQDLAAAAEAGARLLTPEDADWPRLELDRAFGFAATGMSEHVRTYQSDAVTPHALWVRGGAVTPALAQSVAVVGTRAVTRYGVEVTRQIVGGLAAHQWTVVSGGALGIDTAAHEAALAAGGTTVAVTACGIDRVYPARNAALLDRIADVGCVISEYPPGTPPQRHRFLTRNRLVAALTRGTVVVEAAWRSGALNTLSWAEGLGRVAMAVPGPVTGAGSLGCHERIRHGRAQLVTGADDIRSLLGPAGAVDAAEQYELQFAPTAVQGLSRNELRVFDALDPGVGRAAQEVSAVAGLPLALTVHLLVDLGKRGLVAREGVEWRRAEE